ncbi:MAG: MBOAT family O-acyltransferase [Bradymonadaceae bacterium]
MIFNSIEFWLFFAVIVAIYYALSHRWRWLLLLLASYYFYMQWNAAYALIILISTCVDFAAGRAIYAAPNKRKAGWALAVSLATNLGILFTFKYWTFFHTSMGSLLGGMGVDYTPPDLGVLLPVGISFYTFQTMSYTIDIWRGHLKPQRHFGKFALFVAFFPQLVAGPIERARNLLPQFDREVDFDFARVQSGLQLMMWGLFKKVVVADNLGIYVDTVYGNVDQHSGPTLTLATYAFAVQIYCDFSGYSDIAIGAAKVLGFDLMKNFERPYFAQSITEFWRRWHISLSTWLRDYLYIPLGGNRRSTLFTYRNLMITMVLGGLWHGASWNFVIWGTLQGVMLSFSRMTLPYRDRLVLKLGIARPWVAASRMFVTFHLVCFSWIFFRADTFGDAMHIITTIATDRSALNLLDINVLSHGFIGVLVLLAVQILQEWKGSVRELLNRRPRAIKWLAWIALLLGITLLGVEGGSQFIYFQF